jgi:hypothetical protein
MTRKIGQLAFIIAFLAAPVFATTVKKLELQELVSVSDAIAQGTVESVEARWEDQAIYTYTSIRVDEPIKGGPRRALLIRQAGGKIGSLILDAAGTPKFKQGDQVIVFLRDRKNGTFDVVGLSQGKYDIIDNNAVSNVSGLSLVDPKSGQLIEGGNVDKRPLEAFKAKIRELAR